MKTSERRSGLGARAIGGAAALLLALGFEARADAEWVVKPFTGGPSLLYYSVGFPLGDGRTLFFGATPSVAWIFDPTTGAWTSGKTMSPARNFGVSVPLGDGRILLVDENDGTGTLSSTCHIYDPKSDTYAPVAPHDPARATILIADRNTKGIVRLADGRILLAGGFPRGSTSSSTFLSTAEIYDPVANRWTNIGAMATARGVPNLVPMPDGTILAASDDAIAAGRTPVAMDVLDIKSGTWSTGPTPPYLPASAIGLRNGDVLLTSRFDPKAWVMDAKTQAFSALKDPPLRMAPLSLASNGAVFGLAQDDQARAVLLPPDRSGFLLLPAAPLNLLLATYPTVDSIYAIGGARWAAFALVEPGAHCNAGYECKSGFCTDGVCCTSACTDACSRCDVEPKAGTCSPVSGTLNHCAAGMTCVHGGCVAGSGGHCSADATTSIARDGTSAVCAPYFCDSSTGACSNSCATSADCASGYSCDGSTMTCVAVGAAQKQGGCQVSDRGASAGASGAALAMGLLGARARRRSKRRQPSRS